MQEAGSKSSFGKQEGHVSGTVEILGDPVSTAVMVVKAGKGIMLCVSAPQAESLACF